MTKVIQVQNWTPMYQIPCPQLRVWQTVSVVHRMKLTVPEERRVYWEKQVNLLCCWDTDNTT